MNTGNHTIQHPLTEVFGTSVFTIAQSPIAIWTGRLNIPAESVNYGVRRMPIDPLDKVDFFTDFMAAKAAFEKLNSIEVTVHRVEGETT